MKIDCISDLHGFYPKLLGGDLLIIAGDLTAKDDFNGWLDFIGWVKKFDYKYKMKIIVGGNHDNRLEKIPPELHTFGPDTSYLCDSGIEFEGLKIWGSPWTKTFPGMNPYCKAFTCETEEELAEKWKLIPDDIDILITHSPPYGLRDKTIFGNRVGSKSLQMSALNLHNLKLWVTGHIHEDYGVEFDGHLYDCKLVNASHVNERYEAVNKPIRIEI